MIQILKNNELFANIQEKDIPLMLNCLGCIRKTLEKGEFILIAGKSHPALGILLSGKAQVVRENIEGDSMLVGTLKTGDLFGETYACVGLKVLPISVITLEKSEVLLMDISRIVSTCSSACSFHHQLVSNLLRIIAEKNLVLSQKMSYLSHKTIRSRLEAYFTEQVQKNGSFEFSVPLNRSELADYLCIDRSAMSRELSRMKEERILNFTGNNFHWLKNIK